MVPRLRLALRVTLYQPPEISAPQDQSENAHQDNKPQAHRLQRRVVAPSLRKEKEMTLMLDLNELHKQAIWTHSKPAMYLVVAMGDSRLAQ